MRTSLIDSRGILGWNLHRSATQLRKPPDFENRSKQWERPFLRGSDGF
jgi:hypothetical protein